MSNYEIRKKARLLLGNKIFGEKWMTALVAVLVFSAISSALGLVYVGWIFFGCVLVGFVENFMAIARGGENDIGRIFNGFKGDKFAKSLVLCLLQSIFIFLWSLLLIIPGIIKTYSYSMAFYIMNDHPEYTAKQCLDESRRMMDGHKFDLFLLHLSFIGWIIVGALTFGIGILWVEPYMQMSVACFYEEIKNR